MTAFPGLVFNLSIKTNKRVLALSYLFLLYERDLNAQPNNDSFPWPFGFTAEHRFISGDSALFELFLVLR